MAIYWMTQVWEKSTVDKSSHLLAFLAIADNANKAGIAWPGVGTIANMSRQTPRNITRVIKELEKTGELYTHRQNGKVNFYFIYINREKEEAAGVLREWFKLPPEVAGHIVDTLDNLLNRTPDNLSPLTQVSGTPDIAMSPDPLLSLLYNKGGEQTVRSENGYKDLQNEIIGACKKLNVLSLKESDVKNIDILYASEVDSSEIRKFYSSDGQSSWWYTSYWKGKKGQFPTTQDVIDTIEQARAFTGTADGASDLAFLAVREWIGGYRPFAELHPAVQKVVREMGEYNMKNKPPHTWKRQFVDTFDKFISDK